MLPKSPLLSSKTYKDQRPLGSVPINAASAALKGPCGAGGWTWGLLVLLGGGNVNAARIGKRVEGGQDEVKGCSAKVIGAIFQAEQGGNGRSVGASSFEGKGPGFGITAGGQQLISLRGIGL